MSFFREQVAPVECFPSPGNFNVSKLRIRLRCKTPHAQILFSLDGREPVENSDREHGFRCVHYLPLKGYLLRGGGTHTLTVIAYRQGLVPSTRQVFTFRLDSPPSPCRIPLTDHSLARDFQSTTRHAPPLSAKLAKSRAPNSEYVLRGVTPLDAIARRADEDGVPLVVYQMTSNPHVVSRTPGYRRVATPSMKMRMPVIRDVPNGAAPSAAPIDRDLVRATTPATYGWDSGERALSTALTEYSPLQHLPPRSQSALHAASVITNDVKHRVVPRVRDDPQDRLGRARQSRVRTEIALFELKCGMLKEKSGMDAQEDAEELEALTAAKQAVEAECSRVSHISPLFPQITLNQRVVLPQVAAAQSIDREPMRLFLAVDQMGPASALKKFLTSVPYQEAHKAFSSLQFVTAQDLVNLFPSCPATALEWNTALSPLLPSVASEPKFPVKILLGAFRYYIGLSLGMPEVCIMMFMCLWRNVESRQPDGVGRVSFIAAIDAYRRTRGSNEVVVEQLQHILEHQLNWGKEGYVLLVQLEQRFADHCPEIDAALVRLNDWNGIMYQQPLSTWSYL